MPEHSSTVYVANQLFSHDDWLVYEDFDTNYAFVAVHNGVRTAGRSGLRNTGRLGDNIGPQPIAYDTPVGSGVQVRGHATGWPLRPWIRRLALQGGRFDQTFAGLASAIKAEEIQGVRSSNAFATSLGSAWFSNYNGRARTGSLSGLTFGTSPSTSRRASTGRPGRSSTRRRPCRAARSPDVI